MSILKFNKDGVSDIKEKLVTPKIELYKILKDINKNLDIIKDSWKGNRSTVTLAGVDDLKNKNDLVLKKLGENITVLGGVINTYDELENVGVTSSSLTGFPGSPVNPNKLIRVPFGGSEFFTVNTKIDPLAYGSHVFKRGLSQRNANGDKCLMIAQFYA